MKEKLQEQDSESQSVRREILLVMFATPASTGVLSKIDDRLEFGPFLTKVVLKYDLVVADLSLRLRELINFELDYPLVIFVIFLIPLYVLPAFTSRELPDSDTNPWTVISFVCTFFLLFLFEADDGFGAGLKLTLGYLSLLVGVPTLIFGIYSFVRQVVVPEERRMYSKVLWLDGLLEPLVTTFMAVFFIVHGLYRICSADVQTGYLSIFLIICFVSIFFLIGLFGKYVVKGPAYVCIWAFGIVVVEKAATTIAPALNSWIEKI